MQPIVPFQPGLPVWEQVFPFDVSRLEVTDHPSFVGPGFSGTTRPSDLNTDSRQTQSSIIETKQTNIWFNVCL